MTFNSLEDRIVKGHSTKLTTQERVSRTFPSTESELDFNIINTNDITANEEELSRNNRAKSAKLRIIERKKRL